MRKAPSTRGGQGTTVGGIYQAHSTLPARPMKQAPVCIHRPSLERRNTLLVYRSSHFHGYRPVTYSARFFFESLLYLHNESVGIYSRLIPGIAALILAYLIPMHFKTHFPQAESRDYLVFEVYLITSVFCFTISALYHILLCHSQRYHAL